jgi:hypothetical protein
VNPYIDMQVSWIDKDQLKGLLDRLGDSAPQAKAGTQTWETHTMPEAAAEPVAAFTDEEEEVETEEVRIEVSVEQPVAEMEAPAVGASRDTEEESEEEEMEGARPELVGPEVARIRDRLRQVRERAEAAGLLKRPIAPLAAVVAEATKGVEKVNEGAEVDPVWAPAEAGRVDQQGEADEYFEVPVGSLVERVEAFSQWAGRRLQPGELVLLDEHGDVLWGVLAKGALILSAMMAANALSRSTAAGACQAERPVVRQILNSGGQLAVLSCETQAGVIHLAVEHPSRIVDDFEMRLLGQALVSSIAAGT